MNLIFHLLVCSFSLLRGRMDSSRKPMSSVYYVVFKSLSSYLVSVHHFFFLLFYSPHAEDRPGHHLKLYQYCSTDIRDMVQRHIRVRLVFKPGHSLSISSLTAKEIPKVLVIFQATTRARWRGRTTTTKIQMMRMKLSQEEQSEVPMEKSK